MAGEAAGGVSGAQCAATCALRAPLSAGGARACELERLLDRLDHAWLSLLSSKKRRKKELPQCPFLRSSTRFSLSLSWC